MDIYAIHDKKASSYMTPFFVENLISALRAISSVLDEKTSQNNLVKFSEDFALYLIGSYNNTTGLIEAMIPPQYIEEIANLKNGVNNAKNI